MITVHVPRPKNVSEDTLMPIGYKMPLTANEYQQLAARTINADLTNKEILHHAALGLPSEAGEFASFGRSIKAISTTGITRSRSWATAAG